MSELIKDSVTESRIAFIYPGLADGFRAVDRDMWDLYQVRIRMASGIRTQAGQEEIWAKGRTQIEGGRWIIVNRKEIKTFAEPGSSLHEYGLAWDFCFWGADPYLLKKPDLAEVCFTAAADLIVKHGMESGRYWPKSKRDPGHAQNLYGMDLEEIKFLAQKGGVPMVWAEIDKRTQGGDENG